MAQEDLEERTDVVGAIRELMKQELIRQDILFTVQTESVVGYLFGEERISPEELLQILADSEGGTDEDS
jgi:hypothetical protein